jgi:hypothetical protein
MKRFIVWYDETSERNVLVDTFENVDVGRDGGEPEDQTLSRDWDWVVSALNKVAEEAEKYKKDLELERSRLKDARKTIKDLSILLRQQAEEKDLGENINRSYSNLASSLGITGEDITSLAIIARYPNCSDERIKKLRTKLSGRSGIVADLIMGNAETAMADEDALAKLFIEWAANRK